jgi:hypothetical protein
MYEILELDLSFKLHKHAYNVFLITVSQFCVKLTRLIVQTYAVMHKVDLTCTLPCRKL